MWGKKKKKVWYQTQWAIVWYSTRIFSDEVGNTWVQDYPYPRYLWSILWSQGLQCCLVGYNLQDCVGTLNYFFDVHFWHLWYFLLLVLRDTLYFNKIWSTVVKILFYLQSVVWLPSTALSKGQITHRVDNACPTSAIWFQLREKKNTFTWLNLATEAKEYSSAMYLSIARMPYIPLWWSRLIFFFLPYHYFWNAPKFQVKGVQGPSN